MSLNAPLIPSIYQTDNKMKQTTKLSTNIVVIIIKCMMDELIIKAILIGGW